MVSCKIRDYADERGMLVYGYAKHSLGSQVLAGGQSIKKVFKDFTFPMEGVFALIVA